MNAPQVSGSPAKRSDVPTQDSGPSAGTAGGNIGAGAGGGSVESNLAVSCCRRWEVIYYYAIKASWRGRTTSILPYWTEGGGLCARSISGQIVLSESWQGSRCDTISLSKISLFDFTNENRARQSCCWGWKQVSLPGTERSKVVKSRQGR